MFVVLEVIPVPNSIFHVTTYPISVDNEKGVVKKDR